MISIIIVDDVKKSRDTLEKMLLNYCPDSEILGKAGSAKQAYSLICDKQPQLVLLDIEMPNGTGFDLLEMFEDINFEVIFTTAFDQYALKAIKFCALDYLLKPIDIKELIQSIHKASLRINEHSKKDSNYSHLLTNLKHKNSPTNKLALPTQEGLVFIIVNDIIRCEAEGNYTSIFFKDGTRLLTTRKIKGFQELLSEHDFFRIHRSHLVNLNCIEKYYKGDGGYVLMIDGSTIDVARRKKEDFLERLSRV